MQSCAKRQIATPRCRDDFLPLVVEQGIPPEQFIVTEYAVDRPGLVPHGAQVKAIRPICRYPSAAVYTGTGSTDDAGSFRCEPPR